ncbi:MAG TPA: DUF1592 domain-containing protein [Cellvibrio sp.]
MMNLFKISVVSLGIAFSSGALALDLCNVTYETQSSWGGGAQQHVTLVNNGSSLNSWNLTWSSSNNESLLSFWNIPSLTQSGTTMTANGGSGLASGGTYGFDFIVSNPGGAPTTFFLNGKDCKSPLGASSSTASLISSSSSSVKVSSSASSTSSSLSSAVNGGTASWILDGQTSLLTFFTDKVKKDNLGEVGELHTFSELKASIDGNGLAVLSIDLNTVQTNIDLRNQRVKDALFETNILPTLYFKTQLNLSDIDALAVGDSMLQTLSGSLTLHGVSAAVQAQVLISKSATGSLSVSSYKPVLIGAPTYDLDGGIETLRAIMDLLSIGKVVPVYFNLSFQSNINNSVAALSVPVAPAAPASLSGTFNTDTRIASLAWPDSNIETGYLIRTKDNRGFWMTADTLASNQTLFEDLLMTEGAYDYKVIALNGSVPSAPSPINTIVVDKVIIPLSGHDIYMTKCAGCHGENGAGGPSGVPLNVKKDLGIITNYIYEYMPKGKTNKEDCGLDCAKAVADFISSTFWRDPNPFACDSSQINYGARQLKLLTRAEYQNSLRDLVGLDHEVASGLSSDNIVVNLINNTQLSVSPSAYDKYLTVASEVAAWSASRNFSDVVSCNNNYDNNCANAFITQFAPKAFRRPLDTTEKATYTALANGTKTSGDIKAGIQLALEAILSSPQFLYRHELGEKNPNNTSLAADAYELTPYELATWLSYNFAGTTPDATLLQKAANNQLGSDSALRAEAQRLLATADAKQKFGDFVGSWLGTDDLQNSPKDAAKWPGFSALIPHLKREIREDFLSVLLNPNDKFSSLYDANYTYVNGPLAQHYGITGVTGDAFVKVNTTGRGGILANGAFMARWAESVETSPIRRGVRVRERMLCQDVPPPPAGVFAERDKLMEQFKDLLSQPTTTNRLKYHTITKDAPCSTCHAQIINPLGFGMEDFTSTGTQRTTDLNGNLIDAMGALFAPTKIEDTATVLNFTGTKGLGVLMSTLPSAEYCFAQNIFRNAVGVGVEGVSDQPEAQKMSAEEQHGYACEVQTLAKVMKDSSPRALLENLGTMQSARYRKAWSRL